MKCHTLPLATACLGIIAATAMADDWPQWRGPTRQGFSAETGLPNAFPPGGLKLAWKKDCKSPAYEGNGCFRNGSPVSVSGLVYLSGLTGTVYGQERLYCFGLKDGKPLWEYALVDEGGSGNCTPAIDKAAGRLYVTSTGSPYKVSAPYAVACLDLKAGTKIWSLDEGKLRLTPGMADSGSPLLWGSLVITPHHDKLLALNKDTGAVVWSWPDKLAKREEPPAIVDGSAETTKVFREWYQKLDKKAIAYVTGSSSPVLVEVDKRPVIVFQVYRVADTSYCSSMAAVDARTGKPLWLGPWIGSHHTPVFSDGLLVTSIGEGEAAAGQYAQEYFMVAYAPRWTKDSFEFKEVWRIKENVGNRYRLPSPVIVNKTVYWRDYARLWAVDLATGKVRWEQDLFVDPKELWPISSPIWVDGKLFHVSEEGTLRIIKDAGDKPQVLLTQKKVCGETNATPIVVDGKLLLRDQEALYCYPLKP